LFQTTFGTRLPTVVGGSFAFIIPTINIINSESLLIIADDHDRFNATMRAVQGAIIASSILHIVLGFSGLWGILTRFISPVVIAPTIIMVGFGHFEYGFPGVSIYFQIPAALHIENQCHYNFQNLCRCNF
jgi:xanthine/uracil permease